MTAQFKLLILSAVHPRIEGIGAITRKQKFLNNDGRMRSGVRLEENCVFLNLAHVLAKGQTRRKFLTGRHKGRKSLLVGVELHDSKIPGRLAVRVKCHNICLLQINAPTGVNYYYTMQVTKSQQKSSIISQTFPV